MTLEKAVPAIIEAINGASTPLWVSIWSLIASVALAVIAGGALWYAARQFGSSRQQVKVAEEQLEAARLQAEAATVQAEAAREEIKQARISAVFELDRVFESQHLADARKQMKIFRREMENQVNSNPANAHLPEDKKIEVFRGVCARELFDMRDKDNDRYYAILNVVGFFETVGLLVDRGNIGFDEVYDLYGGAIIWTDDVVGGHIEKELEENGEGYLDFFRSLVLKARERRKAG